METQKIKSFTGLRFIMIMVIVLSHFEFLEPLNGFGNFYTIYLHNATFAVDFFFLLSGFGMMLGSISRTRIEEMKFPKISECLAYGIKHIRKIYPFYILTKIFGVCAKGVYAIYKSNFTFNFIWHEIVKNYCEYSRFAIRNRNVVFYTRI